MRTTTLKISDRIVFNILTVIGICIVAALVVTASVKIATKAYSEIHQQ